MNLFHSPYFTAHQPYFDAVRMRRGLGEDISYDAVGEAARVLVLLQDDCDAQAASYVFALCRVRHDPFSFFSDLFFSDLMQMPL
jgi:hypothetical protein